MQRFAFSILYLLAVLSLEADTPLDSKAQVVALIFVSSECPISNKLVPEYRRIHQKFATNDVAIFLVYPNKSDTDTLIQRHRELYSLAIPAVRDTDHTLVKKADATITPEAAVFDSKRQLVYRGRINDQFLSIGRSRAEVSSHDLEEAIAATLAGRPLKEPRIKAVGCYIED